MSLDYKQVWVSNTSISFLLACLQRPLTPYWADIVRTKYWDFNDDATVWGIASANKVTSLVAGTLLEVTGLEATPQTWKDAQNAAIQRISTFLLELDRIGIFLAQENVAIILLENAALAKAVYPHPGCYSFGDVDMLVKPQDFLTIHKALLNAGYRSEVSTDVSLVPSPSTMLHGRVVYDKLLLDGEVLRLNVQHDFVARQWFHDSVELNLEEIFFRAKPVAQDSALYILSPTDFLLQLCIHNASHGYVRRPGVRLHLDTDWLVRHSEMDWEQFLNICRRQGACTRAFYALTISKSLFETPVPDAVLTELQPRGWKDNLLSYILKNTSLFEPDKRQFNKFTYLIFSLLLYDNLPGMLGSFFPSKAWMRERYSLQSDYMLPYFYVRRLLELSFKSINL